MVNLSRRPEVGIAQVCLAENCHEGEEPGSHAAQIAGGLVNKRRNLLCSFAAIQPRPKVPPSRYEL